MTRRNAVLGIVAIGLVVALSRLVGFAPSDGRAPEAPPAARPPDPDSLSLEALRDRVLQGSDLTRDRVLDDQPSYTRYHITYRSGGLKVSGIMNVPKGPGPFPVVILDHGFIRPRVYTNGRGLKREQDYLARKGFVVFHPDYRNHADSDKDTLNEVNFRMGYVKDVMDLVDALRKSDWTFLDKDNVGMLGHSMGGGIALNILVAKPDLVKAVVLFAPVSADPRDNFYRWAANTEMGRRVLQRFGAPDEHPEFWDRISASRYLSEIRAPVMIHHGLDDPSCPIAWSEKLVDSLNAHNKTVTFFKYAHEKHEFINAWPLVMERTSGFFDQYLRKKKGS